MELAAQLDRLIWAQWLMAVATLLIALIAVGAALLGIQTMRRAAHLLDIADRLLDQFAPHAGPLFERAERIAESAAHVSESVQREYDQLQDTIRRANDGLQAVVDDAEARVRRFGAVVDLVQTEAEDLIVDAASTARGLQSASKLLRGDAEPARRRRRG